MNAAADLIRGPLQRCRLYAKIDRWKTALEPHIAEDERLGLWPAMSTIENHGFDGYVSHLKDTVLKHWVDEVFN